MASHLITAGGKRQRPAFVMATSMLGGPEGQGPSATALLGGVAVELVHLGSLYHDDVMDEATTRHHVESVNSRFGNLQAILAGDYLLAKASEIAADISTEVAGLLAATIARLCEGQLIELQDAFQVGRTVPRYEKSIAGKTAALFAAACRIGALIGGLPRDRVEAHTDFGRSYGMAFQIVDDLLDVTRDTSEIGKPAGHDLKQGTITLPVALYAQSLERGGAEWRQLERIANGDLADEAELAEVVAAIRASDAIDQTRRIAAEFVEAAKVDVAFLPDPETRELLEQVAEIALGRTS
jgi:heptaprenyl diphosphate synthase